MNRGVEILLSNKRPLLNYLPLMEFAKMRSIGQMDNDYGRNRQRRYQRFKRFQSAVLTTPKRSRIRVFTRFECQLCERNFVWSFFLGNVEYKCSAFSTDQSFQIEHTFKEIFLKNNCEWHLAWEPWEMRTTHLVTLNGENNYFSCFI